MQSPVSANKAPRSVKNTSEHRIMKTTGPKIPLVKSGRQESSLTTFNKG